MTRAVLSRAASVVFAMSCVSLSLTATVASADPAAQVAARHDYFDGLNAEMKRLGGVTKAFDATTAKAEAANLSKILSTDFRTLFPAGTSSAEVAGSRAKPAIWARFDDFQAHEKALKDAGGAVIAAADAGDGAAFAAAFGKMGGACKACHDTYRAVN